MFVAVFVCFATKAVHLEPVRDLSTEAFLATLRRFVARRGIPTDIHSDNGTNFVGANNQLLEMFESQHQRDAISSECSRKGIRWHFIPPRSPNFGGLWEAAVKTAKTALNRTFGAMKLAIDDFETVLTQIEANMNSRPLVPLSDDPDERDVLTPGHFLIGSPLTSLPDPDYTSVPTGKLRHYQQLQQLVQQHWVRWRKEYLTQLNEHRRKDSNAVPLSIGQLVLVQDDGKPSTSWPIGRIVELHPGDDEIVRVATIKTASGTYKRASTKLYPLPFEENQKQISSDFESADAVH